MVNRRHEKSVLPVVICLTALAHSACSWITPYSDTSIRVENASDAVFDSVIVGFEHRQEAYRDYGPLDPHTASAYRTFDRAYSDGHVRVQTGGRTLEVWPVDYVGEEPLSRGRYTYRLTVGTASNGQPYLNLEFVTDHSLEKVVVPIALAFLAIAIGLLIRYVVVSARDGKRSTV